MDRDGFRSHLKERGIPDEQIDASIPVAEQFEAFLEEIRRGIEPEDAAKEAVIAFSKRMIDRGINTWDNYVALIRYGRFIKNDAVYIAALEIVDGAEALENLHAKLGAEIGEAGRDRIFEGIELPELGTPNLDKPALTRVIMDRLEATVTPETCVKVLGSGLRNLEDDWYLDEKRKYEEAGGIDAYLRRKGADFIAELEKHRDEGTLFFSQPVDDAVIEHVKANPEIEAGVRRGNVVIEAKIPHQAIGYLAATDPREKAYHYCHCPWVKESLRNGKSGISPTFCNCSAAFHKKPYEVIFGHTLQADVLETVLAGDPWCKFAIHLPEGAIPES
jgi:hypothetical protein